MLGKNTASRVTCQWTRSTCGRWHTPGRELGRRSKHFASTDELVSQLDLLPSASISERKWFTWGWAAGKGDHMFWSRIHQQTWKIENFTLCRSKFIFPHKNNQNFTVNRETYEITYFWAFFLLKSIYFKVSTLWCYLQ